MLLLLLRLIIGYVEFEGRGDFPERFINITGRSGIVLWDLERTDDGIKAKITARGYKKLHPAARKTGTSLKITNRRGLPFVLKKYRKRAGLLAGVAAFFAVVYFCSGVIWTVDVVNHTTSLTDEQVRQIACNAGVYPGRSLRSLDAETAKMNIMLLCDRLSWAAVNTGSCRITVVVKEKEPAPVMSELENVCNLKALKDGQIIALNVLEGQTCVKIGDTVAAGDLLAGGLIDTETTGTRKVHARGMVTALTQNVFIGRAQMRGEKRVRTGETKTFKRLYFFNKIFPLYFGNTPGGSCDTEQTLDYLTLFGTRLPVGVETTVFYPTEQLPYTLTASQAQEQAQRQAEAQAQLFLTGTKNGKRSGRVYIENDTVIYELTVNCEENIAYEEKVEFL
ncbi:MAG: sporulation protein YqfD [Clostridia bacterium]|nr:sporulation protein YqfD [Clostridia bacterium]